MSKPVLTATGVACHFPTKKGVIRAVDGVDLTLAHSETLGLVGESGCGKSSLGRALMMLPPPTAGEVKLGNITMSELRGAALRGERGRIQMVFQDPFASLNPRAKVGRIIEAPLIANTSLGKAGRREKVADLISRVGLPPEAARRLPHEFSGGQRQRIGIARALALNPDVIVCDEAVSALDVSVRAQILNLFADLQADTGVALLFISHDLGVVRQISDRVAVMYLGRIVEEAGAQELWDDPQHPYTQALLASIPVLGGGPRQRGARLKGELPSPFSPPTGCRFYSRCPKAEPQCATTEPPAKRAGNRMVRCHFAMAG